MSSQPEWETIAQLGDTSPIDYGGYWIYRDKTGVYEEEGEYLEAPDTDEGTWYVYRFTLDRCKLVGGYLVPLGYDNSWSQPLKNYDQWFHKSLKSGEEIAFCSVDPLIRAAAYRAIGQHWGFENLDSYPLMLNRAEVEARYADEK